MVQLLQPLKYAELTMRKDVIPLWSRPVVTKDTSKALTFRQKCAASQAEIRKINREVRESMKDSESRLKEMEDSVSSMHSQLIASGDSIQALKDPMESITSVRMKVLKSMATYWYSDYFLAVRYRICYIWKNNSILEHAVNSIAALGDDLT